MRADARTLRTGWTTGACAAAAATAAFSALLSQKTRDSVEIFLPNGRRPRFSLVRTGIDGQDQAEAGVLKDAGDDPDVTHGLEIVASVRRRPPGSGVLLRGGCGVGTVTRAGLPLPLGEAAINPGPRAMIERNVRDVARMRNVAPDLEIEISIPGGAAAAEKTMNERLGVVGGLSVLGTTGIVVPYSCSAWISSLRCAVDVARAAGHEHLAAVTGKTSEAGLLRLHPLPALAVVAMGDFAGGLLKYFRRRPVRRVTLAGGAAKLAKLAAGYGDLHSARSRLDMAWAAGLLEPLGASRAQCAEAAACGTASALLEYAEAKGWAWGDAVAQRARNVAAAFAGGRVEIDVLLFDRRGILKGRSP